MGDEVDANHAEVLHHRGCADDFVQRVVDDDTVAGVVVAAWGVIDFRRDVERHLCHAVVVGGWVVDGVGDFIPQLQVGVLHRDGGRARHGIGDADLFH